MTYQELAKALEAALSSANPDQLRVLQSTLTNYAAANPRTVEHLRQAPFVNALLNAIVDAEPSDAKRAPFPRSIPVGELVAAFARGGYTYARSELRGSELGGESCPYLTMTAQGHAVYEMRFQDDAGRWITGNAYVTRDVFGNLVASH